MSQRMRISSIITLLFANIAVGTEAFSILTCRSLFETPLVVKVSSATVSVKWEAQSFKVPRNDCSFSQKQSGEFQCRTETESGTLSLSGRLFRVHGHDYYEVRALETGSPAISSSRYLVERHNFEGTPQPSECMVDNEFLYRH